MRGSRVFRALNLNVEMSFMKKNLLVLTVSAFALIGFTASASIACNDAKKATARAERLEQRNKFLNTKFPKSDSAPVFHHEKARASRVAARS